MNEMVRMDLKLAEESIWECIRQGIHYPQEWRGKLTPEMGYRIQLGILTRLLKTGQQQAGWKVGLTAKSIQQQMGYLEPVFGFLLKTGQVASGGSLVFDELQGPNFENELCLTLGSRLQGPGVTLNQALDAIAFVAPSMEIVERRGDFAADPALSFADNVQQKYFVTGTPIPFDKGALDLSAVELEVIINGEAVDKASGEAVLGNPAASVAWLANKLAEFDRKLEPDQQIMSGSFTRQFPLAQGDLIEVHFAGVGRATVEFT